MNYSLFYLLQTAVWLVPLGTFQFLHFRVWWSTGWRNMPKTETCVNDYVWSAHTTHWFLQRPFVQILFVVYFCSLWKKGIFHVFVSKNSLKLLRCLSVARICSPSNTSPGYSCLSAKSFPYSNFQWFFNLHVTVVTPLTSLFLQFHIDFNIFSFSDGSLKFSAFSFSPPLCSIYCINWLNRYIWP